jgi:hypothetical protein
MPRLGTLVEPAFQPASGVWSMAALPPARQDRGMQSARLGKTKAPRQAGDDSRTGSLRLLICVLADGRLSPATSELARVELARHSEPPIWPRVGFSVRIARAMPSHCLSGPKFTRLPPSDQSGQEGRPPGWVSPNTRPQRAPRAGARPESRVE